MVQTQSIAAAIDSAYRYCSKVSAFVASSSDPTASAVNVPINKTISVTFSLALDETTLTGANITVTPGPVATTISLGTSGTTLFIDPNNNLANNTLYTVTITTGLRGLYGPWTLTPSATDSISFTTA